MADGTGIELEVSRFANPYLEMCRAYIANASTLQAIGRCRALNRRVDSPVTVWILSKTIVPWPIDDLLRWRDVALSPMERMAARGMELESPSDAAAFYHDLFSSVTAAQKAYQRARGSRTNCHLVDLVDIPRIRDIYPGNVHEMAYQAAGHGKRPSRLWCTASGLPGLEERLAEAVGRLAHFKMVEAPAMPPVEATVSVTSAPVPFLELAASESSPSLAAATSSQIVYQTPDGTEFVLPPGGPKVFYAGYWIANGVLEWAGQSVLAQLPGWIKSPGGSAGSPR